MIEKRVAVLQGYFGPSSPGLQRLSGGGKPQLVQPKPMLPRWMPPPAPLPGIRGMIQPRPPRSIQPAPRPGVHTTRLAPGQPDLAGRGQPMEDGVRRAMETFFATDLGGVRIHESPAPSALGALAFTVGEDICFAPGRYDPRSQHGLTLLGSQLSHVLQQREGRMQNPFGAGVAVVRDPALEAEAHHLGALAGRHACGARLGPRPGAASADTGDAGVAQPAIVGLAVAGGALLVGGAAGYGYWRWTQPLPRHGRCAGEGVRHQGRERVVVLRQHRYPAESARQDHVHDRAHLVGDAPA